MTATQTRSRTRTVSAVVVAYRSAGDIGACLAALRASLAGLRSEIIVVDNGSDDDTVALVREQPGELTLVDRGVNDGFARGCHVGADVADGDFLLFVNPDAVVGSGTVRALLAAAERYPDAGILGGRAVLADGSVDPRSWWGRPTLWSTFCFAVGLTAAFPGHPLLDPESPDRWDGRPREVAVVSGALMLVDRRLWDQLEGFDRQLLLYGEDVDLCLRARAAGWRPRVVPEATFEHAVGGSTPGAGRTSLVLRGRASILRRHLPRGTRELGVRLLVLGVGLRAAMTRWRRGRRGALTEPGAWQSAWRARRSWSRGWRVGDVLAGGPEVGGARE